MPRKKKSAASLSLVKAPDPGIVVPEKFTKPITTKSLESGRYQKKLLAFFAPLAVPKAFQALVKAIDEGNMTAIRHTFEMCGLLTPAKGVSIINQNVVRQDNNNAAVARASGGVSDFESIVRTLEDERNASAARDQVFDVTPEGV